MAKKSDKCRYASRYAPGEYVTEAQYITEYICENRSRKDGTELPPYFWKSELWGKFFAYQIMMVNRLLLKYHGSLILAMLRANRHIYMFTPKSLKFIEPLIAKNANTQAAKMMAAEIEFARKPDVTPVDENLPKTRKQAKSGMSKLIEQDEAL